MQRMRYRKSREDERVSRGATTRMAGVVTLTVALGVIGSSPQARSQVVRPSRTRASRFAKPTSA
jgi:hypothetical protein